MQYNADLSPELTKKLAEGPCKKCEYKSLMVHAHRCPYQHGLSDDLTLCKSLRISAYWRKKDKECELAEMRTMMVKKGIMPKFALGDTVYEIYNPFGEYGLARPQKTMVREVFPDQDFTYWLYKVSGHTEYTFVDDVNHYGSPIFATPQECQMYIMQQFVETTKSRAQQLIETAKELNIAIEGAEIKFLEAPKNSQENH